MLDDGCWMLDVEREPNAQSQIQIKPRTVEAELQTPNFELQTSNIQNPTFNISSPIFIQTFLTYGTEDF